MNFNQIILAGNLTRDVEMKQKGEMKYATFTIGLTTFNERIFMNCVAFGKTAEVVSKCTKGSGLLVVGRLSCHSKDDITYYNVKVESVTFTDPKRDECKDCAVEEDMPF